MKSFTKLDINLNSYKSIEKIIIQTLFLLFFFITSNLFATQKLADELSELSKIAISKFDSKAIKLILNSYLNENDSIQAVRIVDTLSGELFVECYKKENQFIFQKAIPTHLLNLHNYTSSVDIKGKIVAEVTIYTQNNTNAIILDREEKLWLNQHKTIKVHNERTWAPYNFNQNSQPLGFSIDYMNLVASKVGLNIEYVTGEWDELLQMAYDKKLDVMLNIVKNEERLKYLLYVGTYAKNISSIIVRDDNQNIKDLESLKGKKVSVVRGFSYENYLRKTHPDIELILVDNMLDTLKAVLYKQADATLGKTVIVNYVMNENGLKGLKFAGDFYTGDDENDKLNIAVRNDYPELQSILKKAMDSITQDELNEIKIKWFGNNKEILSLTENEQKWLNTKEKIRYISNVNWIPFEWQDEFSKELGVLSDLIFMIKERSTLNLEPIKVSSQSEALEKLSTNQADIYAGVIDKDNIFLRYTKKPILTVPYVFVARADDTSDYFNIFDSLKNKKVALVKNSPIYRDLKDEFQDINVTFVEFSQEGFEKLSNKEVDVLIDDVLSAKYNIKNLKFNQCRIVTKLDYNLNIHLAIRESMSEELMNILEKSIDTISQKDLDLIQYKWTELTVQNSVIDWNIIIELLLAITFILFIIFIHNMKLKSLVESKTADIKKQKEELEILLNSFDKNVIFSRTDLNGVITHVSEAFCNLSGFAKDELIGQPHSIVRHQDMPPEFFRDIWNGLKNKNHIIATIKNRKKNGDFYWVESKFEPDYDVNGNLIGYSAIRQNITDKKLFEELSKNLEKIVESRTQELNLAKLTIEEVHKQTKSSIEYASLIQHSLIPLGDIFRKHFNDYFTIWNPKDIVGGDIYFLEELRDDNELLLMMVDCTGHGVPGAFITMLVKAIERQIVAQILNSNEDVSPAKILSIFNKNMRQLLKQNLEDSISNAGFDGGVLYYNKSQKIIKFAGAETPLFYIDENGVLNTIKGNRHSIGYKKSDPNFEFKEHIIDVKNGIRLYLTTDGYLDQNGGEKGFPLGKSKFANIIKNNYSEKFADQQEIFLETLYEYQGKEPRNDDITVIGIKI